MNFLRYNSETGEITSRGYMDPAILNDEILQGLPVIKYENAGSLDLNRSRIDPETRQVVPKDPPPPAPEQPFGPTGITFMQLMALFTPEEKDQILNSQDQDIRLWLMAMSGALYINMTNPDVKTGLQRLVSLEVINDERMDQILNQRAPSE